MNDFALQAPRTGRRRSVRIALAAALGAAVWAAPVLAQNGARPQDLPRDPVTNRRIHDGEPIFLSFNNVPIKDTLEFIIETTGKTVIPDTQALASKVTIISDVPMTRNEALDKLFLAFLDSSGVQVGVIEQRDIIRIGVLDQIAMRDCPVIGPEESLRNRTDEGVIISKVFAMQYRSADTIADVLIEMVPTWSKVEVEAGSNSIVVVTNLGTAKKLEEIIESLDRRGNYETRTFALDYSDASTIAGYILTMFSAAEGGAQPRGGAQQRDQRFNPNDPRFQGRERESGGGTAAAGGGATELRVVPNTRNNTVTVQAEPSIMREIELQIELWDSRADDDAQIMKIYELKYMDAVVVRNILRDLLGQGASVTGGGRGGAAALAQGGAAGAAGSGGTLRLQDLFQVEADGGANRLIVFAKTPASFDYFDRIVEKLDQPGAGNNPLIIELKHADAQELAMELNIAFAPADTNIEFRGREEGLESFEVNQQFGDAGAGSAGTGLEGGGEEAEPLDFWWLAARAREGEVGTQSDLVGKARIMPIFRRNALMIIGPVHYQNRMAEIIGQLDLPGRQVLITAIIAEVELEDLASLGIRWGSGNLSGVPSDNTLVGNAEFDGTVNDVLDSIFDTSVLNVGVNLNAVLQLLQQQTNLRVLSEPRIFTADNEQANFFDGQNIQFVTNDVTDIQTGNLNRAFEFEQVGITLSVRPRITVNRDVDLLVSLELSSLAPGTTQAGGLIIDQRLTSTRAILKDGQTIVISGILREEESDVVRKIPILGDIPLIGALFSSTDINQRRSEIIAFVTPIVVDNPEENEGLNVPFRQRLEELQRPLDEQVKDIEGVEKVWDVDPEAHPFEERGIVSDKEDAEEDTLDENGPDDMDDAGMDDGDADGLA